MLGKLVLGFLIVRPFKKNVGFGFGERQEGPILDYPKGGNNDTRDAETGGSVRARDAGILGGQTCRVGGDEGSPGASEGRSPGASESSPGASAGFKPQGREPAYSETKTYPLYRWDCGAHRPLVIGDG